MAQAQAERAPSTDSSSASGSLAHSPGGRRIDSAHSLHPNGSATTAAASASAASISASNNASSQPPARHGPAAPPAPAPAPAKQPLSDTHRDLLAAQQALGDDCCVSCQLPFDASAGRRRIRLPRCGHWECLQCVQREFASGRVSSSADGIQLECAKQGCRDLVSQRELRYQLPFCWADSSARGRDRGDDAQNQSERKRSRSRSPSPSRSRSRSRSSHSDDAQPQTESDEELVITVRKPRRKITPTAVSDGAAEQAPGAGPAAAAPPAAAAAAAQRSRHNRRKHRGRSRRWSELRSMISLCSSPEDGTGESGRSGDERTSSGADSEGSSSGEEEKAPIAPPTQSAAPTASQSSCPQQAANSDELGRQLDAAVVGVWRLAGRAHWLWQEAAKTKADAEQKQLPTPADPAHSALVNCSSSGENEQLGEKKSAQQTESELHLRCAELKEAVDCERVALQSISTPPVRLLAEQWQTLLARWIGFINESSGRLAQLEECVQRQAITSNALSALRDAGQQLNGFLAHCIGFLNWQRLLPSSTMLCAQTGSTEPPRR